MRTIDADELIHDFEVETHIHLPGELWHITGIKAFIENAPTIEQYGTWIPVTERLPEEPELCLITQKIGTQKVRKTALRSSGEWKFNGRKIKDEAVIAWMPLPEPFREEKKDELLCNDKFQND